MQPAYRTGSTYTGVDESVVGCKPGIVKTVVKVDEGVYKTREVKLTLRYGGYDPDTYDGADGDKCVGPGGASDWTPPQGCVDSLDVVISDVGWLARATTSHFFPPRQPPAATAS